MNITLYLSDKPREFDIGSALKSGFERLGECVRIVMTHHYVAPEPDTQLAVVIGIKGVSKRVMEDYTRSGRHCLLIDKSYFGRTEYLRLSLDGFQPHYAHATPRPMDRWEKVAREFNIHPKPLRKRGQHVIYAGSSQKYCDWHDLGNVSDFAERVCGRLNKTLHSERRILYRPKPSWIEGHKEDVREVAGTQFSGLDKKLYQLLPDCHAVVTHGSNAAVEAVLAGVPAVVISRGACAAEPVAAFDYVGAIDPRFPSDDERLQWLANLAYCQFDIDELSSGLAWDILMPQTVKSAAERVIDPNDMDGVLGQYRAMHTNPKFFRGGSIKGHIEMIGALVKRYGAQTLLDYGCGKGLQYTEWKFHERWGVQMPTLYDPGVPGIDAKPIGKFDGVINTDVMEHIPEAHVPDVIREIIGYARSFVFLCIFTDPARKLLPDGRNVHLTVREPDWWMETIEKSVGGLAESFAVAQPIPGVLDVKEHWTARTNDGVQIICTFRRGVE